jgi:hypothetical protein
VRFGQQLLELGVRSLELTQPAYVWDIHAAELGAPLVKRGFAASAFATYLLDGHADLGLLDEPNDLLFAESALLPIRHSPC